MAGCVKTIQQWIDIQQKIVTCKVALPDNLPKITKKGDFFVLQWDDERDMIMFMLKWS